MWLGIHLLRKGLITAEQFADAVEMQLRSRPPIGRLAAELGTLSMKQIFDILEMQADVSVPFGQIAIQLGYMTDEDLAHLLMCQADRAKPLIEILIDMKVIDRRAANEELDNFKQARALELGPGEPPPETASSPRAPAHPT